MSRRPVLLDASFLVALQRETARGEVGPARRYLPRLRGRPLLFSVVTVEELLEGAADEERTAAAVQRFAVQGSTSLTRAATGSFSAAPRDGWARTMRGSSRRPTWRMPTCSAPIGWPSIGSDGGTSDSSPEALLRFEFPRGA